MPEQQVTVVGGVDTHRDDHVAATIGSLGTLLGVATFPATGAGYGQLLDWMRSWGDLDAVGIEGTGSYGRAWRDVSLLGAWRWWRRSARGAKRAGAGASPIPPTPRRPHGRCCAAKRRSARSPPTVPSKQYGSCTRRGAALSRPAPRRSTSSKDTSSPCPSRSQPPSAGPGHRRFGERLRAPAPQPRRRRRRRQASAARPRAPLPGAQRQISELDTNIARLCAAANPALLAARGVGPDVAATLRIAAGDNPERLTSEASFAALCGASPIEASSGRTVRHRLNRGGDCQANNALWRIAMVRLRHDAGLTLL